MPATPPAARNPAQPESAVFRLALYEPDIPQNAGTMLRLAACLGIAADIIEPCGFPFSDRALRRAGMDYMDRLDLIVHASWAAYRSAAATPPESGRLFLLTTSGDIPYWQADFRPGDTLMVGRESAGVPAEVHAAADSRLLVPMAPGMRSLNVAATAAMALGEALRQTGGFPGSPSPLGDMPQEQTAPTGSAR